MDERPSENPYAAPQATVDVRALPDLAKRARFARGLLIAQIPLSAIAGLSVLYLNTATALADAATLSDPRVLATLGFNCLFMGAFLALVVAFFTWIHAAYVHARVLAPDTRFSPNSAVVCWLVPVLNVVTPLLVLQQLWRVAKYAERWRAARAPSRIVTWGLYCGLMNWAWLSRGLNVLTGARSKSEAWMYVAWTGLTIFFAWRASLLVGEITGMLNERHEDSGREQRRTPEGPQN